MANPLEAPISNFIDSGMALEDGERTVLEGVRKMEQLQTDSLIIGDGGAPRGIITYRDVLFDVVAKGKDPSKTKLKDVMKAPLYTIPKNSKVADAIEIMKRHNIRRLAVVEDGKPVGMISQKAIAGNMARQAVTLPELEIPHKIRCPYCSSLFEDKAKLSSHIDDIHIGRGLFEGNLSRQEDLGSINPANEFPKTL